MLFSEIVGQEEVKQKLIQLVRENRVSHALLFSGPEGNGALPLSVALAQYLNCACRSSSDSCGECPSCRKFAKLIHPDLHFVFPVINSGSGRKTISDEKMAEWRSAFLSDPYLSYERWLQAIDSENKLAGIFVDESDHLVRKLQLTSFEAEYKVMVIWLPEKMNQQSANKILKILEEPPSKTIFILVSEAPMQLLTTIRSRTQQFEVPPVDDQDVLKAILPLVDGDNSIAELIVRNAGGNFVKALSLVQPEENEGDLVQQFAALMRGAWAFTHKSNITPLMEWCEQITSLKREQHKIFLSYSLRMIRECFILSQQPELSLMSAEEQAFAQRFKGFIVPGNVGAIADELFLAFRDVEANGNKNLIFVDLGMKIGALLPSIVS